MNVYTLESGLMLGGWALVALCIASFWIPKVLQWNEKLAELTPLMRELWWTYALYIWGSHVFFAVLALGFSEWLMSGTGAATAMCVFILLWWSIRLWLQFFGFDLSEVQGGFAHRLAKHLLTMLFLGLVTLFGCLLCWNLGWLEAPRI